MAQQPQRSSMSASADKAKLQYMSDDLGEPTNCENCMTCVAQWCWPCYRCTPSTVESHERGIIFRHGRIVPKIFSAGFVFVKPCGVERLVKVDQRVQPIDIPRQDVLTSDSLSVHINAVMYVNVFDPVKALVNVTNYIQATKELAAATLRTVIGEMQLEHFMAQQKAVADRIQSLLDTATDDWGVRVSSVVIKDVSLPQELKRAMAAQAEAHRLAEAKNIASQAEVRSAESLAEAARVLNNTPGAMQLRYLQTMQTISAENSSTLIFPLPMELMRFVEGITGRHA